MFNLFSTPSEELNSKIRKLEDAINRAQPLFGGRGLKSEWDDVFTLAAEIAADFKSVRYPTKAERDTAWQRFFNLRSKAFDIRKNQTHDHSKRHYNELMSEVGACLYSATGDFLVEIQGNPGYR